METLILIISFIFSTALTMFIFLLNGALKQKSIRMKDALILGVIILVGTVIMFFLAKFNMCYIDWIITKGV